MNRTLKSIRLFIGTSPGELLLEEISRNIARLKSSPWARSVRWVDPEQIHMTLKFLGSTNPGLMSNLVENFRDRMHFETITYEVDSIQLFPSVTRPKVVAAMVANNERLNELVRRLNEFATAYGLPANREYFRGHLTLARCGPNFPRDLAFEPLQVNMTEKLTRITLFRSDTRGTGPVYTPLETILCRANKS